MVIELLRQSVSIDQERLDVLKRVVPEAFADGKINWATLREALGEYLEDEEPRAEHFGLTWPGKREARRLSSLPSQGTLIPMPGQGVNEEMTGNLFIEGDNLEVLKLLQKSYSGRIKLIYIDPPYNTGNDFIYKDNFQQPLEDYLKKTRQVDEKNQLLTTNPRSNGRFHSNWLSMMYPRLLLARNLMRTDGIIFISIDDHEVHNLRLLMNEIFGEENFIANIVWKRTVSKAVSGKGITVSHDHILCYGRSSDATIKKLKVTDISEYKNPDNDPRGPYKLQKLERTLEGARPSMTFSVETPMGQFIRTWSVNPKKYQEMLDDKRIAFSKTGMPYYKQFLSEFEGVLPDTWWDKIGGFNQTGTRELKQLFDGEDVFTSPKPVSLIRTMLTLTAEADDLVLDFFTGSCTTAQAVLEFNRDDDKNYKFILVQLPEPTNDKILKTIAEIGKERIRRVIRKLDEEDSAKLNLSSNDPEDQGFRVFKLNKSNFKAWKDYQGEDIRELQTTFLNFESPLVDGWREQDVVTEILLLEGFLLDSKVILQGQFVSNRVLLAESDFVEHKLFICLDDQITDETIQQLQLPLSEDVFVCLDSALTDKAKMQLADNCNIKTI